MTQPISNLGRTNSSGQLSASPQTFELDLLQSGASNYQEPSLDFSGTMAGASTGNPYAAGAGAVADIVKFGVQSYMGSKAEERKQRDLAQLRKRTEQIRSEDMKREGQRYQTQLDFQIEDRETASKSRDKQSRIDSFNRFYNTFQTKLNNNMMLKDRFVQRGHRGL